jgi:hypothetical protein
MLSGLVGTPKRFGVKFDSRPWYQLPEEGGKAAGA